MISGRRQRWIRRCRRLVAGAVVCLALAAVAFLFASWMFPFPMERLDRWPQSPRVIDRHGRVMMQLVGADDQWRFPVALEEMSPWLVSATVAVEDERFFAHPGVDAVAVARAIGQNAAAGDVVSGASTITMQLCRMMDDRPRTLSAKAIESFRALQMERLIDKRRIIELYLNVAPYGGNVRGVEAAAWWYFDRPAAELSLAESALIAGLPQSPERLRPDRNLDAAVARQRTVLRRMLETGAIDRRQHEEAITQPIVIVRRSGQRIEAPHASWAAMPADREGVIRTTVDLDVQRDAERLVGERIAWLPAGTHAAAVIIEIETGAILAMVGSADAGEPEGGQVNGATAWRSPGSALKPFVYAAAFETGRLTPQSVVHDVPIERGGWRPANFDERYRGEVTAADALRQSLNVPAILVAEGVGIGRCAGLMEAAGVRWPADAERRGGLALVTGAVEVRLVDLVNAYATIGRGGTRLDAHLVEGAPGRSVRVMDANVCAVIDELLSSHARRPNGMHDLHGDAVPWFMWKTGTSSARRDAWSVGHNGRYAAGVWIGRASGAGRYEYVGREAAEPLLAALFDLSAIRAARSPHRETATIVVRHPLPPPTEVAEGLRIVEPRDGARFVAIEGTVTLAASANRDETVTWFLDGTALSREAAGRLRLGVGRHEVRCVDASGRSDAVRVTVLPP